MKKYLLLSALFAFFCSQASAQTVPALINYQGQLTDANGTNLPTADYVLTFTIHDAATGGSQIWGPQVFDGVGGQGHGPKIPVVQGFFNVMLGPVDTGGTSIKDAFNATNRFVQIKVGTGAPITPRQQILSAPFAVRAESAEKLKAPGGTAVAMSVTGVGSVGIGTSTPRTDFEVRGKSYIVGGIAGLNNPDPNPALTVEGTPDQSNGRLMYLRAPWVSFHSDRYFMLGYDGNGVSKFSIRGDGLVNAAAFQGDGSNLTGVGAASITDGSVGTSELTDRSVTGTKVAVGGLLLENLASEVVNRLVPPGSIIAYGGATPPSGWLLCDGRPVRSSAYGALFTAISAAWGNGSDDGDPATDFNLPDLRGVFLRGDDSSPNTGVRGLDPDRGGRSESKAGGNSNSVGSYQADAFQGHWHDLWGDNDAGGFLNGGFRPNRIEASEINRIPNVRHVRTPITDGQNGPPRTSSENRPKNAYVNYIIKY